MAFANGMHSTVLDRFNDILFISINSNVSIRRFKSSFIITHLSDMFFLRDIGYY